MPHVLLSATCRNTPADRGVTPDVMADPVMTIDPWPHVYPSQTAKLVMIAYRCAPCAVCQEAEEVKVCTPVRLGLISLLRRLSAEADSQRRTIIC